VSAFAARRGAKFLSALVAARREITERARRGAARNF